MVANSDDTFEKNSKKAAALRFDKEKNAAPHLAAKGRGWLAEQIIAVAKEHDIPIKTDADLVEVLMAQRHSTVITRLMP